MDIKYGKFTKLENKYFKEFPKLQSLNITNNILADNNAFVSSTNLVHLDLSLNCIKSINQIQLSELINLETLILSRNRIECIEENAFLNLKNLKKLDLSFNRLSILNPRCFNGIENLKYLDLRYNNFTYFDPSTFDYICSIKQILLFHSPIFNLDEILAFNERGK